MLSIGKLAGGGEDYYLEAVAAGVEDYYLGAGEAPGVWLAGAEAPALAGEVIAEDLRAVLAGRSSDGEQLAAAPPGPAARAGLRPHIQRPEVGVAPPRARPASGAVEGRGRPRGGCRVGPRVPKAPRRVPSPQRWRAGAHPGRGPGGRRLSPSPLAQPGPYTTLALILGHAAADGLIARNPATGRDRRRPIKLKEPHRERDFLRPHEVPVYLEACSDFWLPRALTLILTGCRVGELLGVRWDDVDWQGSAIIIGRAVKLDGVGSAKGDETGRRVDMGPRLAAALRDHRARQAEKDMGWGPEPRLPGPARRTRQREAAPRLRAPAGAEGRRPADHPGEPRAATHRRGLSGRC
jgi:hypothetical protein